MKIGLDWDGTVNADPMAFKGVVMILLDADHDVVVTTWRSAPSSTSGWEHGDTMWPDMESIFNLWGFKLPIVYCDGKAKRDCYPADIWIDDNPASVVFSLEAKPRFEENPEDYDRDVLRLDSDGFDPVRVTWKQLKPASNALVSPVNFEEESIM